MQEVSEGKYRIAFNPALVRGMGYYAGTIFEIVSPKFSASVGGGGRYDNMIGKYTKEAVPEETRQATCEARGRRSLWSIFNG